MEAVQDCDLSEHDHAGAGSEWSHFVEIGHTTKTDEMIRQTGQS